MTDGGEPIDDPADIVAGEFDDVDIEGDADRLELYFEADASDGEISTTAIIGEVTAAADTETLGVVASRIEHLAETGRIAHEETLADGDSDDDTRDREFIFPGASETVTTTNILHEITTQGRQLSSQSRGYPSARALH